MRSSNSFKVKKGGHEITKSNDIAIFENIYNAQSIEEENKRKLRFMKDN